MGRSLRASAWALAALLLLALAAGGGYLVSARQGAEALRENARHRLDLLAAAIDAEVARANHIPGVIALSPDVLTLLRHPGAARQQAANRYLEQLSAQHVDSLALFVLDPGGRVVASSDWGLTDNLLGADLSLRPYFRAALQGAPFRQYAEDILRNEPGYFFAQPIRDEAADWRIVGVAVMKASLRAVERHWLQSDAPALIADGSGIVVLAAPAAWRFASLQPLAGEQAAELARVQYDGRQLGAMSLDIDPGKIAAGTVMRFSGRAAAALGDDGAAQSWLVSGRNLPGTAWQLIVLAGLQPLRQQALLHGALAAAAAGCLLLWALFLRQRRRAIRARLAAQATLEAANRVLEDTVAARTGDLQRTVASLEQEVAERQHAEATLRAAQEELVQAGKLAVLGRLATGITHELNQPLGAVRTLAGNAVEFLRRGDATTAERNLHLVCDLADQMGGIIGPLKNFARKSPAVPSRVDVAQVVGNALFLLDARLARAGVAVDNRCAAGGRYAWCDANRLQQVLINLIGNAADAMDARSERRLEIDCDCAGASADGADGAGGAGGAGDKLVLAVADTGCGLPEAVLDRLFEPFFTTKAEGEGLGLGLAISRDIVRSFGGELRAENRAGGGARFVIVLPAAAPLPEDAKIAHARSLAEEKSRR